jgi:hypothetical protein
MPLGINSCAYRIQVNRPRGPSANFARIAVLEIASGVVGKSGIVPSSKALVTLSI